MSRLEKMKINRILACLAVVSILAVMGCSVDSPTAPDQVATDPPNTGANSWKISVNVSPSQIQAAADVPLTVNIKVESRTDGSKPPNGTTMSVSTSLGDFNAKDSGIKSVPVEIHSGKASALLFGGNVVATGTVVARLGGSEQRDTFSVIGAQEAVITSVEPNRGTESGGTRVRINGIGFVEPLRVEFGDIYGTVVSVTSTQIEVITPPAPLDLLDTVDCGNGGTQYIATPVNVTVEFAGDALDAVLDNGFFYTPNNGTCIL